MSQLETKELVEIIVFLVGSLKNEKNEGKNKIDFDRMGMETRWKDIIQ